MNPTVRLCLVLHNHQPIGNFDGVIEQAYQDSYLPFLEVFEPYQHLKLSLHTSGPLMLWLAENHPEYIQRVAALVAADRVEIVGGPFYEPILTMLPSRDRVGQIVKYTNWLQETFNTSIQGMWMPERVWESQLVRDLVPAGMQYTILDDYHFLAAGWNREQLTNYFTTEDDGHVLRVFPGSERLRYLLPFAAAHETISYCRSIAEQAPGSVLLFGDDGEKFGTWPDTKVHVYEKGWLRQFFDQLTENREWLHTSTPRAVISETRPAGRIFLPDCSYREMTEWSLPVSQQAVYDDVIHRLQDSPQWQQYQQFMRGGFWRNFRVKYSEANEMYCRMLEVSRRLESLRETDSDAALLSQAEDHLYRGQCNCPYWHGAFGGIYLPHLRNATYRELIAADTMIELSSGRDETWVDVSSEDFDKDLLPEVRMANDQLIAYIAPARGGMLYELDMRAVQHNILATMQRRPEVYHKKILAGNTTSHEAAASIHDRVVFKQEGLNERIFYDCYPRKSMMDHFFDSDISIDAIASGKALERGDFVALPFEAKIRRGQGKVQTQLRRSGNAWGVPITLTKAVTLTAGSDSLHVTYLFEGLPPGRPFHYAMEWNFAGLPSGADDRFFYNSDNQSLGQLGKQIDIHDTNFLGLVDQWLGVSVQMVTNRPASLWAFPVESVSQSESGFELVHQSVCVMPHWIITGDSEGKWSVSLDVVFAAQHVPNARVSSELVRQ